MFSLRKSSAISISHCCWVTLWHSWCKNGHDGIFIWWSSIHTLIDLAVWHGALSCWIKPILRVGEHCQSGRKHIFFQDNLVRGLIHVLFAKMNLPDSSIAKAPPDHHRSSTKFSAWVRDTETSPALRLTIRGPSVGQSWKLDSSEKMTLLQSSSVPSLWSFANLGLALLCLLMMKAFF